MTIEELAQLALDVLSAQRKYFQNRTQENLTASTKIEAQLRRAAAEIVYGQKHLTESE